VELFYKYQEAGIREYWIVEPEHPGLCAGRRNAFASFPIVVISASISVSVKRYSSACITSAGRGFRAKPVHATDQISPRLIRIDLLSNVVNKIKHFIFGLKRGDTLPVRHICVFFHFLFFFIIFC
jgi:hypothetical protein